MVKEEFYQFKEKEFDDDNYEELLNLRAHIIDESDRIPHTSSDFLDDDYAQHVSAKDIKTFS